MGVIVIITFVVVIVAMVIGEILTERGIKKSNGGTLPDWWV